MRQLLYLILSAKQKRVRITAKRTLPKAETLQAIHAWPSWQMENEFYEFARAQFQYLKEQVLLSSTGTATPTTTTTLRAIAKFNPK